MLLSYHWFFFCSLVLLSLKSVFCVIEAFKVWHPSQCRPRSIKTEVTGAKLGQKGELFLRVISVSRLYQVDCKGPACKEWSVSKILLEINENSETTWNTALIAWEISLNSLRLSRGWNEIVLLVDISRKNGFA